MLNAVVIMDGKDFNKIARFYMEKLYKLFIPPNFKHIFFNNGFESFNPEPGLSMLGALQIVVTRDPNYICI
jgi:hypothetical protein